jgi:hypothetical protein
MSHDLPGAIDAFPRLVGGLWDKTWTVSSKLYMIMYLQTTTINLCGLHESLISSYNGMRGQNRNLHFDGSCDMPPIWDLAFARTLGAEAWMAKLHIIYGNVATCNGYPSM